MEKIYIIKDKSDFITDSEFHENISLTSENLSEDWHFHDFIVKLFTENNPSKLVIPIDINDNPFDGLLLGLHIRLNNELTHDEKCIPIIFISEKHSFESIFSDPALSIKQNRALPHYLLTTPNIYLEKPNLDIILAIFELNKPMSIFDYKYKFLDSIKILPSETTGKHSLANIWGAFRLAQTTGHTKLLNENTELLKKQKDLYFKYVSANSELSNSQNSVPKLTISSRQKNILLIDDEANKGWGVVLKAIFSDANFEVVSKMNDELFTLFYKRANEKSLETNSEGLPKWDLILLDLRLDENEDKGENANKLAKDYSGAILLDVIKKANEGTQVIIFTASNKAWNMRDLMEMGADGFFVKESPEYSQDNGFSLNNYMSFEKQVDECFEKDLLRHLFKINQVIEKRLKQESFPYRYEYISENTVSFIKIYLDQAFNAISEYRPTRKEYALYCFLDYYKVIEILCKDMIDYNSEKYFIWKKRNRGKIDFILKSPLVSKIEPIKRADNSIETYKKSDYTPIEDDEKYYKGRLSSSLQFSGLLLLRFEFNNNTVRDFMILNNIRNTAAHSSDDQEITIENVLELAKLLEKVFQKI